MIELEIKHYDSEFCYITVINRKAVRAIICKNGKVLMVESKRVGDLKFPGGGIEKGETDKQALIREVKEESGHNIVKIGDLAFRVTEKSKDKESNKTLFKMISDYYICEVNDVIDKLDLDDYEKALGFCPKWTSINEAIEINSEVLKSEQSTKWIKRELMILNEIIARNIPLTIAST